HGAGHPAVRLAQFPEGDPPRRPNGDAIWIGVGVGPHLGGDVDHPQRPFGEVTAITSTLIETGLKFKTGERQTRRRTTERGACRMTTPIGAHGHAGTAESVTSFSMRRTIAAVPVSVSTMSRCSCSTLAFISLSM